MEEIDFINKYLGVEWVNRGEDVNGIDCWGLVLASFREIDKRELPSVAGYADINCSTEDAAKTVDMGLFSESQPTNGAIMTILNTKGDITHVGRCLAGRVIHATSALGVRLDTYQTINDKYRNVRYIKYD